MAIHQPAAAAVDDDVLDPADAVHDLGQGLALMCRVGAPVELVGYEGGRVFLAVAYYSGLPIFCHGGLLSTN